jgi:DNA-binding GntR family transcriptional regulator
MARYAEIADALRTRIQSGEFAVGDQLPTITELQRTYDVPSLGTIRAAQQLLVDEGMVETRHGVGAFVISTESIKGVSVTDELAAAQAAIAKAIRALAAPGTVTFDITDSSVYFVLTEALREFEGHHRSYHDDFPDDPNAGSRLAWANIAAAMLDQIENTP